MNGIDLLITIAGIGLVVFLVVIARWQAWDARRRGERLEDRQIIQCLVLGERSWFDGSR